MISPVKIAEALITALKSTTALTSLVGSEIREDEWMGGDFVYPAVRVRLTSMGPPSNHNGECRPNVAKLQFSILCYTEGRSSKKCLELGAVVEGALKNKHIETSDIAPMSRITIPEGGYVFPVAETENLWRCEVQGLWEVKDKNS